MDVKTMKKERGVLMNKHEWIEAALGSIEEAMNYLERTGAIPKDMNMDKPQGKNEEAFVHLWNAYLRLTE